MLMKNNFQSNGKGRNQRVWQLLISMLIILTMGIGQMWGADKSATTSLNLSNLTSSNWGSWSDGTPIISGDYFKISAYMGRTSSSQSWIGYTGGNNGDYNSGNGWSSTGKFAGSDALSATCKYMAMQPSRSMYFRVTGCKAVYALVQNTKSGTTYRRTTISAFEYTTSRAASASATMTSSDNSTTVEEISVTGLDATKTYEILLAGTESNNAYLMEIVFEKSSSTLDPSATPTISAHPATAAANYIKDETATTLSVAATNGGSGTLTYQWYKNTTNSNASGSAIEGATSASYTPSTAEVGTLYYYCAVTNTETGKSATTVKSNVSGAITTQLNPVGTGHTLTWNLVVRTSSSGESTLETATTDIGTSSKSSSSSYLTTLTDLTGVGVKRTTDGKSNNTGKIETPSAYDKDKYVTMNFTVTDGYQFTPSAVSIKTVAVSTAKDLKFEFSDANGSYSVTKQNLSTSGTAATNELDFSSCDKAFTGTVTIKIYVYGADNQYRLSTPLTITGTVASAGPCEPPTDPSVTSTNWIYVPGETINLTASATGTTASTTYTWYKGADLATAKAAGAIQAAKTSAQGGTTYSCTASDAYRYWCVISNGSCEASASYDIKIYKFYLYDNSGSDVSNAAFATIDRENNKISVDVALANAAYTYKFKVTDGFGTWYGKNESTIISSTNWLDGLVADEANVGLTSTGAGSYTIDYYYNVNNVVVTYPTAYTITHSTATNGTYTIKVGDADAVSTDATAYYGQTITLAASPADGHIFSAWTVMNGETPVEVTNNSFTMPAGNVTVSATFVEAPTPCYSFTAPTDQAVTFHKDDAITGSTGGSINVYSEAMNGDNSKNGIAFDSNGLKLAGGSDDRIRVTLNNLMQVGSVITVNLTSGTGTSNPRGLYLKNESNSNVKDANNQNVLFGWATTPETSTQATFTYTVRANDGLAGKNVFILQRSNTVWIRSMSVSECGAELHALTSAIDPIAADGKATITLSKTLVATGATATATYSDIDAAYDFDEWVVSGATIDDAKANPVTITMGSTDATITLKLKAAALKHTVTYYDGDAIPANKLDDELIVEGNHPTGAGLAPRKLGYTFAGWSTSNGGAVVALNTISVDADMPLFAVWNAIDCASKTGTIYTMEIAVAPAANCTIKTASGYSATWDLYQYEGVSGGEAMIGNTGSSNNCILQTNKTVLLKDNTSYMKLDFDCPLKEGDTIKTNVTGSGKAAYISTADTRPEESAALAIISNSTTGKLVVPAALNNATSVYLWKGGGNVTITSIEIVRPVKHSVTFNMNGHGDDVAAQSVVDGAKATEPTPAPTADGYRFVKWQLSGADYDFDAAVTTDIELDAVWQKTWTVTFDSDGGSAVAAATVDDGQAVAKPADPTKDGFDFVEWQWNSATYNFASAVEANITLVATWEVAQDDATLSALSYNGNAIDVASAEDVSGVQTYTVHLPWGSTINPALISVTSTASTATKSSITYNNEEKQATFQVTSGNGTVTINYAIQFVIDPKRGTSIIKATTNNVVTGLIGGTIDQSYSGNANSRKLNKNNYFGVTLANDETFQEGDVFIVNITTPADLGKFMIYADKNRTELIADQGIVYTKPNVASPVVCPTGEMMLVLPAAANGKKSLYLSRENVDNSEQWNVTFSYIEVTREMAPVIKSFKFGDEAATINESAKTITYEVAYGTDVTALTPTVEAYGNNGATYTPDGATDFTSPVVYTVTDTYNELHTDYTVTVNIAAPSENAYLASLSVAGYTLDFNKEVEDYNIVLDYGTTVLPEITYAVEDAGLATAVKVEGGVNGSTTITVTPQAGAGYKKVYTINFSVSTNPKYVIYDGSTMTNIASATGADGSTGFSYSLASNIPLSGDAISSSWGGKDYTHVIKGFKPTDNTNNIVSFVIPEGYAAKVRLVGSTNSDTKERKMFIAMSASKDAADAIDNYIITSSTYDAQGFVSDYLLPNTYYLGSTDAMRLFEFSVTLYPIDVERAMTQGRFGTICYPNGGRLLGAMLLEIAYFDPDQKKIFFDEVIGGQMVAGAPYLFLPNEGVDKFAIVYTDNVNAPAGHHNGLYGSYTQEALPTDGNHYIMLNNQYCKVVEANTYVGANRAYIQLDKIGNDYVAPSYGRRRVSLGVQQAEVATGLEDLNVGDQPIKIMINGQMYILRGEKMYDATGRLVK